MAKILLHILKLLIYLNLFLPSPSMVWWYIIVKSYLSMQVV